MPNIETPDGTRIHYESMGSGQPVVLAHGFGASLDMWWPQAQALASKYRFIAWDARGQGGSSAPAEREQYSMPTFAADLRYLLEALDAVEGAVIGGMSFGGQIALQYVVDHPEDTRALILSDSTTRGDAAATGAIPPQFQGERPYEYSYLAMESRPDLTPALPGLTMPSLVIYGEQDLYIGVGIHRLSAGLPNRRMVCLRGASHGSSAQRPNEWSAAALRFLDEVDSGTFVGGEETI